MKAIPNLKRGFTLIELIVVIVILGVLAATALPKFIEARQTARIAALDGLAGTLRSTAQTVYALCLANISKGCDPNNAYQPSVTMGGRVYDLGRGYPNSGDTLNVAQIDTMINYAGFTASLPSPGITRFALAGAPTPATCYVDFQDAYWSGNGVYKIMINSTGC